MKYKVLGWSLFMTALITISDLLLHGYAGSTVLIWSIIIVFLVSLLLFSTVAKRMQKEKK